MPTSQDKRKERKEGKKAETRKRRRRRGGEKEEDDEEEEETEGEEMIKLILPKDSNKYLEIWCNITPYFNSLFSCVYMCVCGHMWSVHVYVGICTPV